MIGVKTRDGESFDKMLRRFKKNCEKSGMISDMKKNQHFEKPSEKKRRKRNSAKRKRLSLENMK